MGCVCAKSIPVVLDYEGMIRRPLPMNEARVPVPRAISASPEQNVAGNDETGNEYNVPLLRTLSADPEQNVAGDDETGNEYNVPLLRTLSANREQDDTVIMEGFGETEGNEYQVPVLRTISANVERNGTMVRAEDGDLRKQVAMSRIISTDRSVTSAVNRERSVTSRANRERSVTSAANREWNGTSRNRAGKVSLVKGGTGNIRVGRPPDKKDIPPTISGNYYRDQQRRYSQGWGTFGNIRSIPRASEAEQIAAGWPTWLVDVGKDAIRGWIPRTEESYQKLEMIGQGTYSNVYKGRDLLQNNKMVALKEVRFKVADPISVEFMSREILILRRLDHPNIVKLEAVVTSRTSSTVYLVFEYMEHDLLDLATYPGVNFTEPQVKCLMRQLLSGLDFCHNNGVLHRDLKCSNLLMDNNGVLKIADFGLATLFDCHERIELTSHVVTLWYRPPELILGAIRYGGAVDLWSAGCIFGELYAGRPIMPGRTEVEQLHRIFKLCGSPPEEYWTRSNYPNTSMLNTGQTYRRQIAQCFKNIPDSAVRLLERLLAIDPQHRGTARTALKTEYFRTGPLACEPSSLPKYPKMQEEELRLGGQGYKGEKVESNYVRPYQEARQAPDANDELAKQRRQEQLKRRIAYFNSLKEDEATSFPFDSPISETRNDHPNRASGSRPLAQGSGLGRKPPNITTRPDLWKPSATNETLTRLQELGNNQMVVSKVPILDPRIVPKARKLTYSGSSSICMEEHRKDHEERFEEVSRRLNREMWGRLGIDNDMDFY